MNIFTSRPPVALKLPVTIYPKPTKKQITIQCNDNSLLGRETIVEIYDILGNV